MKPVHSTCLIGLVLIGLGGMGDAVAGTPPELCYGGYPLMLLTQGECQNWLRQRSELQKQGDLKSLDTLDAQMRALLDDRAKVCPCTNQQVQYAPQTNNYYPARF